MTNTERAALERRIDELCAEVERLRQENQSIGMAAYELGRKSMADENAKLREQVDYMTPIALYAASERERDHMHELGIEVD